MKALIALMALFGFAAIYSKAPMAQSLYKSIGPDGKVVYSDHPPTEGRIEKTMEFKNLPGNTLPPAQLEQLKQKKTSQKAAYTDQPVIYTTSWCGYCKKAKSYMSTKGISYKEYDIETDSGMASYAQAGGSGGVPLLVFRGQSVRGFSMEAYDTLFGR